jgi:putative nucleotidyltransferase with HDIG domain
MLPPIVVGVYLRCWNRCLVCFKKNRKFNMIGCSAFAVFGILLDVFTAMGETVLVAFLSVFFNAGGGMVVDKIQKNISQVAPLPSNIRRIMSIVNDEEADMARLAKVVEEDPTLTMQALNLCNSAYYSLPTPVNSVAHAVRYLGIEAVGGLALAAYFRGLMQLGTKKSNPWLEGAGNHLLMTGQLSEKLSRSAGGLVPPSTAFTAGLLHDVGKLIFSKLDDVYALDVRDLVQSGGIYAVDAEKQILGMDHAEAGARLAEHWKIPEVIVDAIRNHHNPLAMESISTSYVYLADRLYYLMKLEGDLDDFFIQSANYQAMEVAGLSRENVKEAVDAFGE